MFGFNKKKNSKEYDNFLKYEQIIPINKKAFELDIQINQNYSLLEKYLHGGFDEWYDAFKIKAKVNGFERWWINIPSDFRCYFPVVYLKKTIDDKNYYFVCENEKDNIELFEKYKAITEKRKVDAKTKHNLDMADKFYSILVNDAKNFIEENERKSEECFNDAKATFETIKERM